MAKKTSAVQVVVYEMQPDEPLSETLLKDIEEAVSNLVKTQHSVAYTITRA